MRNILLYLSLLILLGCTQNNQTAISPVLQTNGCADKPTGVLTPKNVAPISVTNAVSTISDTVRSGQDVGYSFDAQAGQKFSYQTQDDICIWVITPETQIITGVYLPKSGKYTLQVSVPQGSKTFNLDVTFGNLTARQPSNNSGSSQATNSTSVSVSPLAQPVISSAPSVTQFSTSTSNSSGISLDQDTAIQLLNNWLSAKPKIFASPFDRSLVAQYTTGPLYHDITKPGGSIDWLQNNGSYYRYNDIKVNEASNFSTAGSRPSMTVTVYEDRVLQGPNGIDPKQSGTSTRTFTYYFEQDNGNWKIYDYRAL